MQQLDAAAIEQIGIPRILLMEHAGLAVARATQALRSASSHAVLICCGQGWNGGDGFAAGRHLVNWGVPVRVAMIGSFEHLRPEPSIYASILRRLGVPLVEMGSAPEPSSGAAGVSGRVMAWLAECHVVIDALLGIGGRGAVREPTASLITQVNRAGKPVVAVDLPSGVDGDTGAVHGVAIRATVTVALGLPKAGCFLGEGPRHTGRMLCDPISIPDTLLSGGRA